MGLTEDKRPLRGVRRQAVAAGLADRYQREEVSVGELAASIGRRPSLVRRLLREAGVAVDGARTDAELAEALADRWRQRTSIASMVRDTGLDRRRARRLIESAGVTVPARRPRPTGADAREVVRRYRAGATLRALAAETGCSYGTIRAVVLDAGVRLRPRGG